MSISIQKIDWKIFFQHKQPVPTSLLFEEFYNWIQDHPDVFVDVVSYEHVAGGPQIVLAGYHAHYIIDETDSKMGLVYSRRSVLANSSNENVLKTTFASLLEGVNKLIAKKIPSVEFNLNKFAFTVNDRSLTSDREKTYETIKSLLNYFITTNLDNKVKSLTTENDPEKRLTVKIELEKKLTPIECYKKLKN